MHLLSVESNQLQVKYQISVWRNRARVKVLTDSHNSTWAPLSLHFIYKKDIVQGSLFCRTPFLMEYLFLLFHQYWAACKPVKCYPNVASIVANNKRVVNTWATPSSKPGITWPAPSLKVKGFPLSLDESNFVPSWSYIDLALNVILLNSNVACLPTNPIKWNHRLDCLVSKPCFLLQGRLRKLFFCTWVMHCDCLAVFRIVFSISCDDHFHMDLF